MTDNRNTPNPEPPTNPIGALTDVISQPFEILGDVPVVGDVMDIVTEATGLNILVDSLEMIGQGAALTRYAGFSEFTTTLSENPDLMGKLSQLLGIDENASPADTINQLQELAAADPQIFERLNRVIGNEHFEPFLDEILGNETLRNAFTGSDPSNQQIINIIQGADERIQRNPDYFLNAQRFLHENEGLVNTFAAQAGGSLTDPWAALDQGMGQGNLLAGLMQGLQALFQGDFQGFFNGMRELFSGMGLGQLFGNMQQHVSGVQDPQQVVQSQPGSGLTRIVGGPEQPGTSPQTPPAPDQEGPRQSAPIPGAPGS